MFFIKKIKLLIFIFFIKYKKSDRLISAGLIWPELRQFWPALRKSGFTEKSCAGPDPARMNFESKFSGPDPDPGPVRVRVSGFWVPFAGLYPGGLVMERNLQKYHATLYTQT